MTTKNPFEVPSEMRDLASRSVEQARKAFETFVSAAQKASSLGETAQNPVQKNLADAAKRTVGYAEQNVSAAFAMAERMVQAKTVEEIVKIQGDFMQSQASAIQAQLQETGSVVQKQMQDAGAVVQKKVQEATASIKNTGKASSKKP